MIRSLYLRVFSITLISILLSAPPRAFAQDWNPTVKVSGIEVSLPSNATAWLDSFSVHSKAPALVLMQFNALPSAAQRAQLSEAGITIYSYLSARIFIARIERKAKKELATASAIRSIVPYDVRWKVSSAITQVWSSPKLVNLLVSFLPDADKASIIDRIASIGGSIKKTPLSDHGFYEVTVPGDKIVPLAQWYGVLYINEAATYEKLNLESQSGTKANVAHASITSGGWGLLGDSITVGVGDNIPGVYHVDVMERVTNYNPAPPTDNHGQHVNGTVGGAGTINPKGEGYAPHARLVDNLYNLIWANTGAMYQAHNMTITNNSYSAYGPSCASSGKYDAYAQVLDTIALQYPKVLHVFAAGNSGDLTCSSFPLHFATIPTGFQEAKNVLAVGNMTKLYVPYHHTSRGPVADGRLKPEICAIGAAILSTNIHGIDYFNNSGTSMSSPAVSGSAALIQQRYKQLHAGVAPDAALTKTILMNGATDLGNPGPDYTYGFGMLDVPHSLKIIDNSWFLQGSIANTATQSPLTITVPANTSQLKVMLYWADAPASPLAATQLVNDLDLSVTDPSSTTHLPFILDPTPANVNNPATTGADHVNNVEQVVINNPAAGSYTVGVNGYSIPFGPQSYVLAYDIIPVGVNITSPFQGGGYKSDDSLRIYWNASVGTNTFTLEFSTDNGSTWTTLSSTIPADQRVFPWYPTNINSGQCLFRLTRNVTSEQFTTGLFTINTQPVVARSAVQCPGYFNTIWNAIPNATSYNILRKAGLYLQQVGNTTDTFYNAGGLSLDTIYYFAVQPVFGSSQGFRSIALDGYANSGTCIGSFSDGDLMADKVLAPTSGRESTSTALTSSETLSVLVRNLDDAIISSYKVSYQLNANPWVSQTFTNFPANTSNTVSFTGLNLSTPGRYTIRIAITNLSTTDGISRNDTIVKVVTQLQNAAVNLTTGFTDGFESASAITTNLDTMGFVPNEHWDYDNDIDLCRMRTFVNPDITISGQRSITMDMDRNTAPGLNRLIGTFNLGSYSTSANEVRMEFDYKLHGIPRYQDSNKVFVRGADNQPWVPLYNYDRSVTPGVIVKSSSLSLNDALIAASQSFTSSTQIAFSQRDTSTVSLNDYGNGLTLDNVKLYEVVNDISLVGVVSPAGAGCALSSTTPLTITLRNGVTATISNIKVYYRLDSGPVDSEVIASLAGKTTINFTFAQTMNVSGLGLHTLNIWLAAPFDSYHSNDSILNYTFRNEPLISSYPYLQNFEANDGYWYSEGHNNSWEYGTPASIAINKAASGVKAWKTNLNGYYNDNELSYLYSPCFDISGLTTPMLSFSVNMQIENCGATLCDAAWVEYAVGSGAWTKLGANGQGTNWYNTTGQLWSIESPVRWRVASIAIPAATQPVRFRIVFNSDPGTGFDGIAIDDIHIYDRAYPTYTGGAVGPVTAAVSGTTYTSFTTGGRIMAQINPLSNNLGNTDVRIYDHAYIIDTSSSQYYLPKNFVINPQNQPSDSATVRLFISDADVLTLVNATGCAACSKPSDAYKLGITKYHNANTALEDGDLKNNSGGNYNYIPYTRIKWVPYDSGYYAEVNLTSFSELWFNDGGPANAFPLPITSIEFDAHKISNTAVLANWISHVDTQVSEYELQRSENAVDFTAIAHIVSVQDNGHSYTYTDVPGSISVPALYYRLKYTVRDGKDYYSATRQVIWNGSGAAVRLYPNPTTDGHISIAWTTRPDNVLDATVTDVTGKTVVKRTMVAGGFINNTDLNMGPVAKGIYFLHCTVAGEKFEFKIVVQ